MEVVVVVVLEAVVAVVLEAAVVAKREPIVPSHYLFPFEIGMQW